MAAHNSDERSGTAEEGYFVGAMLAKGIVDPEGPVLVIDEEDDEDGAIREILSNLSITGNAPWVKMKVYGSQWKAVPPDATYELMAKAGLGWTFKYNVNDESIYLDTSLGVMESTSDVFQVSFIRALFDLRAEVEPGKDGPEIRLHISNLETLMAVRVLMLKVGIWCNLLDPADSLDVPNRYLERFRERIGFRRTDLIRDLHTALWGSPEGQRGQAASRPNCTGPLSKVRVADCELDAIMEQSKTACVYMVEDTPNAVPTRFPILYKTEVEFDNEICKLAGFSDFIVLFSRNLRNGKLVSLLVDSNRVDEERIQNDYIKTMMGEDAAVYGCTVIFAMMVGEPADLDRAEVSEYIASFTVGE